jgi:integral membrane protein (TIGR01906 family)
MNQKQRFENLITVSITILVPIVLFMLTIRLFITPLFAQVAYRLPGFPPDPFGFAQSDRLKWSEPTIIYLVNNDDISALEELEFEDGAPIYNGRELSHMEDVKALVVGMRVALAIAVILLALLSFLAVRMGLENRLWSAYNRGGWALVGFIGVILVFVALSFSNLFTWFHQIFFESGTWQFYTSDTLIRLFPMRFWRDAFIFVGIMSLLLGVLTIVISKKKFISD